MLIEMNGSVDMKPQIIDTDTHFTEPPNLWTDRLPSSWGDQVMQVKWDDVTQTEVWVIGDRVIGGAWSLLAYGTGHVANSEAARPKTRDDTHPATWDQSERVRVMDDAGIRAAVLYPNFAGLNAKFFRQGMANDEIAVAHLRAYNDYQVEWCANYPGRFIPMLVIPFWDVDESVAEINRMASSGFGGIVTTAAPQAHGEPLLGDRHWDPLWRSCVDAGLSVSFHIGSGNTLDPAELERESLMPPATHLSYSAVPHMIDNGKYVHDLLLCGVLARYPELRFVSVESGLGWVPFVLEAADYHFRKARRELSSHPWGDLLPSDLFRRQVYVNYWFEQLDEHLVDRIGEDNILFETDFPHRTCLEKPDVAAVVSTLQHTFSEEVQQKILWRNAAALYGLDVPEPS